MSSGDPPLLRVGLPCILALVALVAALLLVEGAPLPSVNILARHPHWASTKVGLAMPPMGATAYTRTTVALAAGALDLSAWHGYQEVLTREPLSPGQVELHVALEEPGAVFHLVWGRTAAGQAGLRLSLDPRQPSQLYRANAEGRFTFRRPLPPMPALGKHRHRLVARFAPDTVTLELDKQHLGELRGPLPRRHQVGFRGGNRRAVADNVEVRDAAGRVLLRDDFSTPPRSSWPLPAAVLAVSLLLGAALHLRHRRRHPRIVHWLTFTGALFVLLLAGATRLVLERRAAAYPDHPCDVDWGEARPPDKAWQNIIAELRRRHGSPRSSGSRRVLLLGGSQLWGEGASSPERSYAARFCAQLARESVPGVECLRVGLPGATALALLRFWDDHRSWLQPDAAVVSVSVNDRRNRAEMQRSLEDLLDQLARRNVPVVLVAEPMAEDPPALLENHRVLERLATARGLLLVDAHRHLRRFRDEGMLWWDPYHPSDYGHALMARVLASEVGPYLRARWQH